MEPLIRRSVSNFRRRAAPFYGLFLADLLVAIASCATRLRSRHPRPHAQPPRRILRPHPRPVRVMCSRSQPICHVLRDKPPGSDGSIPPCRALRSSRRERSRIHQCHPWPSPIPDFLISTLDLPWSLDSWTFPECIIGLNTLSSIRVHPWFKNLCPEPFPDFPIQNPSPSPHPVLSASSVAKIVRPKNSVRLVLDFRISTLDRPWSLELGCLGLPCGIKGANTSPPSSAPSVRPSRSPSPAVAIRPCEPWQAIRPCAPRRSCPPRAPGGGFAWHRAALVRPASRGSFASGARSPGGILFAQQAAAGPASP